MTKIFASKTVENQPLEGNIVKKEYHLLFYLKQPRNKVDIIYATMFFKTLDIMQQKTDP